MTQLCASAITWNEVRLCSNCVSCKDINNWAIENNWPQWPTQEHILAIPTTLKSCGGALRTAEEEFLKTHWKKNATENVTQKWNKQTQKMEDLPTYKHRTKYPASIEGGYWRTVDRLNTLQTIARKHMDEAFQIPNPKFSYEKAQNTLPKNTSLVECIHIDQCDLKIVSKEA